MKKRKINQKKKSLLKNFYLWTLAIVAGSLIIIGTLTVVQKGRSLFTGDNSAVKSKLKSVINPGGLFSNSGKWLLVSGPKVFCQNGKPNNEMISKAGLGSGFKNACRGINMEWTKQTRCDTDNDLEFQCK